MNTTTPTTSGNGSNNNGSNRQNRNTKQSNFQNRRRFGKQHNNNNSNNKKNLSTSTQKFVGRCDDLKGNIFDCSNAKQSDLFVSTKREIEQYIGRTYTYGADTKWSLEN